VGNSAKMLNFAEADAIIVSWDAKYTYEQLPPITAIRNTDNDDNPVTTPHTDRVAVQCGLLLDNF
jgi:hypothetical protein